MMNSCEASGWLIALMAVVGTGISLGAGLFAAAAVIKAGYLICRRVAGELLAWVDLREAVAEWKAAHPGKARRYGEGSGPWRDW